MVSPSMSFNGKVSSHIALVCIEFSEESTYRWHSCKVKLVYDKGYLIGIWDKIPLKSCDHSLRLHS